MDSRDELVDCHICGRGTPNYMRALKCFICWTATDANPGKIPAAMRVELALYAGKRVPLTRIRRSYGLE